MRRSFSIAGIAAIAMPAIASAEQPGNALFIVLPSQPLAASLQAIAQRFGVELLFSQDTLGELRAPSISGRVTVQQALELLLAGSNLAVRRSSDGSFIVIAADSRSPPAEAAIPEILVIGKRTQNTDIRRTEDDVRPYQVIDRQEIATSHAATIEELTARRMPANAQGATLSQQGAGVGGETASSINLRGLGTDQTLILVDGRRLPQMPGFTAGFLQSDVNALAPESLDRVEAITATAGGIYGPGATAGVVNLILRRDYRGLDVAVTRGITARGDAPYRRIDVRLGFTPDHGATDVMLDVSRSNFGGLSADDRDYLYRATLRSFANDPAYVSQYATPAAASINIVSQDGSGLALKPSFGGTALNAPYTYAVPADGRPSAALAQELISNAGKLDLVPSSTSGGGGSTLLSGRRTSSVISSAHHRAGAVGFFVDYLRLTNKGHATEGYESARTTLAADDPGNPFVQAVNIYAPDPNLPIKYDFTTRVTRATGGAIVDLPAKWRGEIDYSIGLSERRLHAYGHDFTLAGYTSLYSQLYGGEDVRNPLADYSAYKSSLNGLLGPFSTSYIQKNRFRDASLRLAGPVLRLGGGDLTATFLAEHRRERVSGGSFLSVSPLIETTGTTPLDDYAEVTRSLYGEVRAPIVHADSGIWPLRGLELQFAVRNDSVATKSSLGELAAGGAGTRTVHNTGTVYTAGFKVSPIPGIILRASVATGEQALTAAELSRRVFIGVGFSAVPDRKRGNTTSFNLFDEVLGGPSDPKPERARSLSAGIVVEPAFLRGLRVSVDFTRIAKSRENVSTIAGGADYFLANEELFPGRIIRLPLTAQDAALGYTGGVITQVDASSLQTGGTTVDAIDAAAELKVPTCSGAIDFHAAGTWQPHFRQTLGFDLPARNYTNASDGALSLRANAGARWTSGPMTLSIDGQFFGGYRIAGAVEFLSNIQERYILLQGETRVAPQATLDLGVEYRVSLPRAGASGRPRTMEWRFGIQNVLDSRPSTLVGAPGDSNVYVDPRRRRLELTVTAGI